MSQKSKVLGYLKSRPYITQLVAKQVFGVERLASRITDLKDEGHEIKKQTCKDESGKRYTRYSLVDIQPPIQIIQNCASVLWGSGRKDQAKTRN